MAIVPRDAVPTSSVTDAGCGSRVIINTAVGAGVGFIGAIVALAFKVPSASPKLNTGRIFRQLCLDILPMTTGGAAVYTTVSCMTESNRGVRDWVNPAAGGAVMGALVVGVRRKSPVAAVVGAAVFAVAAANVEIADSLTGTSRHLAGSETEPALGRPTSLVATQLK